MRTSTTPTRAHPERSATMIVARSVVPGRDKECEEWLGAERLAEMEPLLDGDRTVNVGWSEEPR